MHPYVLLAAVAAATVISTKAVMEGMNCELDILSGALVAKCHKKIVLPLLTYLALLS